MNKIPESTLQVIWSNNWHVLGTRKADFLIDLFNTVTDKQLTIVTDDDSYFARLKIKCPNHVVHVLPFSHSVDATSDRVYVMMANSPDHAKVLHDKANGKCQLFTICDYDTKVWASEESSMLLNKLHVYEGDLNGITRYVKEAVNE